MQMMRAKIIRRIEQVFVELPFELVGEWVDADTLKISVQWPRDFDTKLFIAATFEGDGCGIIWTAPGEGAPQPSMVSYSDGKALNEMFERLEEKVRYLPEPPGYQHSCECGRYKPWLYDAETRCDHCRSVVRLRPKPERERRPW